MPTLLQVIPFEISFCQFALRYGSFATHDRTTDARLDGYPYQDVKISYHGEPIADTAGELLGTLSIPMWCVDSSRTASSPCWCMPHVCCRWLPSMQTWHETR